MLPSLVILSTGLTQLYLRNPRNLYYEEVAKLQTVKMQIVFKAIGRSYSKFYLTPASFIVFSFS